MPCYFQKGTCVICLYLYIITDKHRSSASFMMYERQFTDSHPEKMTTNDYQRTAIVLSLLTCASYNFLLCPTVHVLLKMLHVKILVSKITYQSCTGILP